jgi:membrane protein YqaA with SNARE-associated domain
MWQNLPHPHLLGLAGFVALSIGALIVHQYTGDYSAYGYFGAFLVSLIGTGSIVLPIPAVLVVFALGGMLNPLLVGLIAGVGMALGEITGYLLGYAGEDVLKKVKYYNMAKEWMRNRGMFTIFVLAFIPNPLFDLAGAAAGALRYPLSYFLFACWVGKTLKSLLLAFGGAWGLHYFADWFSFFPGLG